MDTPFKPPAAAIEFLQQADPVLGKFISSFGEITRRKTISNPLEALISSIIGQQVSRPAARSINSKFNNLISCQFEPEHVLSFNDEQLRGCGLSRPKIKYVKSLCQAIVDGSVDLNNLEALSDKEVIRMLTTVNGIGIWTAEMFLIFCLERPNILSYNDLGIRRGIKNLYQLQELPTKGFVDQLRQRYAPFNTLASFYLWEASV